MPTSKPSTKIAYISAQESANILTQKLGRTISPDYIRKLRNVKSIQVNATTKLYARSDVERATIRPRKSTLG